MRGLNCLSRLFKTVKRLFKIKLYEQLLRIEMTLCVLNSEEKLVALKLEQAQHLNYKTAKELDRKGSL